jgi:hypothetical protein
VGTTEQQRLTIMSENKLNKKTTLVGRIGISTQTAQRRSSTQENVEKREPPSTPNHHTAPPPPDD